MRGEFIGVWSETWREIWRPLTGRDGVPEDIFCELALGTGRANCNFVKPVAVGLQSETARATQPSDLQTFLDSVIATHGARVAIAERLRPIRGPRVRRPDLQQRGPLIYVESRT